MPYFSTRSKVNLDGCHEDIQKICLEEIKHIDFCITSGHRPLTEQFELFKKGRKLENGIWVIDDIKKIVTYKDGFKKLSDHNYYPSRAFDEAPWPIDWKDENRFFVLANRLMTTAKFLLNTGKISHELLWGGNWKMKDLPHLYIRKPQCSGNCQ